MGEIKLLKYELVQMEKNYKTDKSIFIKDRTVFIIGRRTDNPVIKNIFFVNDFFPRFQIEADEEIDLILTKELKKKHIKNIYSKNDGKKWNYKNLGGVKELLTIQMYRTSDIYELRDLFSLTYEANIKFTEVLKKEKSIHGFFFIPSYVFDMKTRHYKIYGIDYYLIKEKELKGEEMTLETISGD